MKRILIYLILFPFFLSVSSQSIELTFTAVDNESNVQLDSIKVMNRTHGGDTVLYWPDTVLSFYYVGTHEIPIEENTFEVFQNYPNPVVDQTTISLYVPEKDRVNIIVTDILGRTSSQLDQVLDKGKQSFRFIPGNGNIYFFIAQWKGYRSSIKIINLSSHSNTCSLEHLGNSVEVTGLKGEKVFREFLFNPGDELLYIGYSDTLQSGMLDHPEETQTYTFQYAYNIPCPGTQTVEYEGQVYNTIQIFSQCWLKENLNVGWMIPNTGDMSDNGWIEKYCYNNEEDSCAKYGGLYQWDEMMQYSDQPGIQGICPEGWHLPTNEEWKLLEGAADSQYGIGDPVWDQANDDYRGFDAGKHLKSDHGWFPGGNGTDSYGFSGLPAGDRSLDTYMYGNGEFGFWWTSTGNTYDLSMSLDLYYLQSGVLRAWSNNMHGFSARCIRDDDYIPSIELTFTAINNNSYIQLDSMKIINRSQDGEIMIHWPDTSLFLPYELEFTPGDELLYIGYADTLESGILDNPEENQTYTFQYATNIPCPGTPTVEYEGQTYNTIQIFSQCWLKENLNVGIMIQGDVPQEDNDTIEKYCYHNEPDSCATYGGLYQWNEMMQYSLQEGMQGICPPGWHLPTDEEWKLLEGSVDSQYGIGGNIWDDWGGRGNDAGTNLKTTSHWYNNGNGTDRFGFSGLPGGSCDGSGEFYDLGLFACWPTSTDQSTGCALGRYLHDGPTACRDCFIKHFGIGVRCIKD